MLDTKISRLKISASEALGSTCSRIELDGVDISGIVNTIEFRHAAGELPDIRLTLSAWALDLDIDLPEVKVSKCPVVGHVNRQI